MITGSYGDWKGKNWKALDISVVNNHYTDLLNNV